MGEPQEPVPPSGYMTLIPLSGEVFLDLSSMLSLALTFSARRHIHNMRRSTQLMQVMQMQMLMQMQDSLSDQVLAGLELDSESNAKICS